MEASKRCTHCGSMLPLSQFHWKDKGHTVRTSWCKECQGISAKASRQKKLEHYRHMNREWAKRHPELIRLYKERREGRISGIESPLLSGPREERLTAAQIDKWLEGGEL